MAPHIVVKNLVKRYGTKSVLDVDELVVERGEVLAVIGPNGSGKSTLLRLIAHLEKPTGGSIEFVGGDSAKNDLSIRRRLAFVFQDPLLFTGTVFDNIAYGLRMRKIAKDEIKQRVKEAAEMFGIIHLLDRPANLLSGGEAQRTSLARAFILKPESLLLDEPMASLDPPARESLIIDLSEVLGHMKTTVIYITHELTEAMMLGDRCAFIDEGRIVQIGSSRDVMAYPINQKIADFVGVENILKGRIVGRDNGLARVEIYSSEIEAVSNSELTDKVWVFIRPENVTIALADPANPTSARNCFSGAITKILDLGALYRVVIDCGFPLVVFITKRSIEEMGLYVGQPVWASFKASGVHVVSREGERVYEQV
ncbi:MAG: ABC transporter ATP-binding protein [Actinobacteria bacterium]|nr:ABC transporter ATP-binding protein [Actinomycetota bacterium]